MRLQARASGHHYHIQLAGAGAPVLLLHGFSGNCASWARLAAGLQAGYQVVRLDILGHGLSDSPPQAGSYTMPALAADIIDLLDQLGLPQSRLIGYSMGGRLALYMALHYPARFTALVLESASPGLEDEASRKARRQSDAALANRIEARGLEWFVDYWEALPLWRSQSSLPKPTLAAQREQRLQNNTLGLANSLRGTGAGAQPSLWPSLSRLSCPALLLAGELDGKFLEINSEMARRIPKARLVQVPGAGHNCHLEQPKAFGSAVRSFLDSL